MTSRPFKRSSLFHPGIAVSGVDEDIYTLKEEFTISGTGVQMIQDVDGGNLVYDFKYTLPSGSTFICKDRFCEDYNTLCLANVTDKKYIGKCYGDECMDDYWSHNRW